MSGSFSRGPGPPFASDDEFLENFEQTLSVQQKQMSELKEQLLQFEADKKEKAASVKLKADECYQKLMNLKSGANKSKAKTSKDNEVGKDSDILSPSMIPDIQDNKENEKKIDSTTPIPALPLSQKMLLLKQQTEENKKKMAERINNQKGMALKVNKLLEQFDNMQPVFNPVVGISADLVDCTDVDFLKNKIQSLERTVSQLNTQLQESRQNESISDLLKSNMHYTELQNELNLDDKSMLLHMQNLLIEKDSEKQQLLNQVFDLQENLKEKDSVIDSKTKAITLMSEDLSRKGKNTVDLLEETKLEMVRMQHNFVQIEANLQEEVNNLKMELGRKTIEIVELTDFNKQLEEDNKILLNKSNSIIESMPKDVYSSEIDELKSDIELKNKRIEELTNQNKIVEDQFSVLQEKICKYDEETMKGSLKDSIEHLERELELKTRRIEELTEHVNILETERVTLQEKLDDYTKSPSEYQNKEIAELRNENKSLTEINAKQEKKINELNADIQLMIIQGSNQSSKSPKKGNKKFKKGQSNADNEHISQLQNQIQQLGKELAEHQEYIAVKDDENNNLRQKFEEIKQQLENKSKEILLLQEEINKLEKEAANPSNKDEDVIKLQQLLDDTKANSKKQLKYLQKQVDSFGKISDAHQAVVNLNQKVFELNNRVAELEEEKGNLQLHLVDYDTNQVPDTEINSKLAELKSLCQSQINSIALLESQKFDLVQDLHIARQQIASLEDEIADLTQSEENVVSSEINNIQLEEKLENLTKINDDLSQSCDELRKEKVTLQENVADLNKLNEDLTEKLNACICENEELVKKIDRIERLNAEKVSSAESIEIVENLTHKEKMEIENYEKGLSICEDEPQETIEREDVMVTKDIACEASEDETDLNISVAKLTEESSDLMEKISLFTQERKEVMGRLELLTLENQSLLDRISQLESIIDSKIIEHENLTKEIGRLQLLNEDIETEKTDLVEKLNQLTADRNVLQDDMNILLNEIKDLKSRNENDSEYTKLKTLYEALLEENKNSKCANDMLNEKISELDGSYNEVLKNLQTIQEEYELHKQTTFKKDCEIKDIIYKMDKEKEKYQKDIEELNRSNTELMEQLSIVRNQAHTDLSNKELLYKEEVNKLNEELQRLSGLVKSSEETQKLYEELNDTKIKLERTEQEQFNCNQLIQDKDYTISALNEQIMELYNQIERLTNENKDMENEISGLMEEAARNNGKINQLLSDTKVKDSEFEKLLEDLQEKQKELVSLQNNIKQLQSLQSSDDDKYLELQEVNKKLELKNRENIEKMKKLAANLKKKSALCAEYETKLNETENNYSKIIENAKQQQDDNKLEEYANELKDKIEEITQLQNQVQKLLQANEELKQKESERIDILNRIGRLEQAIQEKETQNNELLDRINEHKFNYETSLEAVKAKLNEKEVYIESLEAENTSNKEKVSKLIDGLASIDERRRVLEECAEDLNAKLSEKNAVCFEFANNEDILIKRMEALVNEDAILATKMQELNELNDQLNLNIQELTKQNLDLVSRLSEHESKIQGQEKIEKNLRDAENENSNLLLLNNQLQSDVKRLNDDLKAKDDEHQKQLDEMENDFSSQLQILENARRASAEEIEKLRDSNDSLQDEIIKLKDTLHQLEQSKADLERDITWIKLQNDSMLSASEEVDNLSKNIDEKQSEIIFLQEKLSKAELLLSSNTTNVDDSLIERLDNEIAQLRNKIFEKDKEIECYQRQNMQLQMAASFGVANEVPFFQNSYNQDDIKVALAEKEDMIQNLQETIKTLRVEISEKAEKEAVIQNLQETVTVLQNKISEQHKSKPKQNEELQANSKEVPFFQSFFSQNTSSVENSNQVLHKKINHLEGVITEQSRKIEDLNNVIIAKDNDIKILQSSVPSKASPFLQNYFNQDQNNENIFLNKERSESLEEKVKNLEIILSVKTEHIDELQALIIKKENEVTALQNSASSLASRMEEMIAAYQYLQNEFEKKQKEINELIQPKNESLTFKDSMHNSDILKLQNRIEELEEMLSRARNEKEEAFMKLQQLVFDMENLKKQNIQLDIEDQSSEPSTMYKDTVDVNLPVHSEQDNLEVVEDVIIAKKTYLCHKDEVQEDSGWGFDAEDPFIEEKYQQSTSNQSFDLHNKIGILEIQVKNLEDEKCQINEDLKQYQAKLAKSMMKLKEYKNKNTALQDQIKTLKSSSDGLDSAIEEVLTLRIEELENELRSHKAETEKSVTEKNNLNKRIDVLVAANEKMIESKENQDLELERLNMLVKQLQLQPKRQESETRNTKSEDIKIKETNSSNSNDQEIQKLQKVIQELSIDNEELQALLDDQKSSYEEREKKLSSANLGLTSQVDELTKKIQEVREFSQTSNSEELQTLMDNIKTYQDHILAILKNNDLCSNRSELINSNDSINTFIKHLTLIDKYIKNLKESNDKNDKVISDQKELINNLKQQIIDKNKEIEDLQSKIEEINTSFVTSQQYKDEIELLNASLLQKSKEVEILRSEHDYQQQANDFQAIIAMDKSTIAELNRQLLEKNDYIKTIQTQYESMMGANAEVQNLHTYIKELQHIIDCDKNSISNLQAEVFDKTKQLEYLQNIDKENQNLKQEIQGHLRNIHDLQQTFSTAGRTDDELLSTNNNEILNLQQENLNLKQMIEQNKNVIDDLNTRLFDATAQIECLMHSNTTGGKGDDLNIKIEQYQKTIALLETEVLDKNNQIAQVQFKLNNNEEIIKLQKQYDELNIKYIHKCEELNDIQRLEHKSKNDADDLNVMIQSKQSSIENLQASLLEKSTCLEQLQNENSICSKECLSLQENIDELNAALEKSRNQIDILTRELTEKSQKIDNLEVGKLEGAEEFQTRQMELEDQLRTCNEQWSQVVEQRCREIADSWKVHLVEIESQFSEKEQSLSAHIAELEEQIKDSNTVIEKLNSLSKSDDELSLLRVAVEDKQKHVESLTKETEDLRFKLEALENDNKAKGDKLTLLEQELIEVQVNANKEISKLTDNLNSHQQDHASLVANFEQLTEIHKSSQQQNENDVSSKNAEIENLSRDLTEKCKELDMVSRQVEDLTSTLEEEQRQVSSMRSALESQELELVTLKEQLGLQKVQNESAIESVAIKQDTKPSTSSPTSTNQSELDLAMYMLHQRDMRCEELTVEIMSLLQERDTLQLRLSNALRLNESIKDYNRSTEEDTKSSTLHTETSATAGPTASEEADQIKKGITVKKTKDFEMLKNKLSELHALDHSRDLRIFDDRKLRQQQQMALVERDFDKLPKEAKQQLIDADYTLSRDYQGPSTSLLNWLWGKGTKKVEHL